MVIDLVPGATASAAESGRSWSLPIPQLMHVEAPALPLGGEPEDLLRAVDELWQSLP